MLEQPVNSSTPTAAAANRNLVRTFTRASPRILSADRPEHVFADGRNQLFDGVLAVILGGPVVGVLLRFNIVEIDLLTERNNGDDLPGSGR